MPGTTEEPRAHKRPKTVYMAASATITKPHPLGIKPTGNALLSTTSVPRTKALGPLLGTLPDELLMTIAQELTRPEDLLHLGHTCKALYGFAWTDELWKHMVHRYDRAPGKWYGSWRRTFWRAAVDSEAGEVNISCKDVLFSDLLYRPFQCAQVDYARIVRRVLEEEPVRGVIPVMDERDMTLEKFAGAEGWYAKPFMLNLEAGRPAASWTVAELVDRFGDVVFRQEYMDWKLRVYNEYMQGNEDESPLYLFDCRSEAMKGALSSEYRVPAAEVIGDKQDFFTLLGRVRPDHRWLILGPARSGSSFHKDPNATSAWNAVLTGHKYWVMFPKGGGDGASSRRPPPPGITTDADESEVTSPCSIAEWFLGGFYDQARQERAGEFMHGVCGPGQMMHVPSGWWHLVVNLDECMALTGNFVPGANLGVVLDFLKNKPDQISGFKWAALRAELEGSAAETSEAAAAETGVETGDCCDDDVSDEAATKVFDLLCERIRGCGADSPFSGRLESALAEVGVIEERRRVAKEQLEREGERERMAAAASAAACTGDGKSKQWHDLVDTEEAGSFSFGFALEE